MQLRMSVRVREIMRVSVMVSMVGVIMRVSVMVSMVWVSVILQLRVGHGYIKTTVRTNVKISVMASVILEVKTG